MTRIRHDLEAWLDKSEWTFDELRRWLKGYELPAVGYDREAYWWIVSSLSRADHYDEKMASRLAFFLESTKPYQESSEDKEDSRLFYNLFSLAAGLGCKHQLGNALRDMFNWFATQEDSQKEFFGGSEQYNLNNAFREALITNQTDMTLRDVWRRGLEGNSEVFPLGDVYSHFRGIVHLNNEGQPAIEDIGWALGRMTDYLESETDRHRKFRRCLEKVKEVWSTDATLRWDKILFIQAMNNGWREWAIVELPSLAVRTSAVSVGREGFLIWEIYLPFLRQLKVPFEVIRNAGILYEICASAEASLFLIKTAPTVEQIRLCSPFRKYKSILGVANQGFMDLELYFISSREPEFASAVDNGRRTILAKLGFPCETQITTTSIGTTYYADLTLSLNEFTPHPHLFVGNLTTSAVFQYP